MAFRLIDGVLEQWNIGSTTKLMGVQSFSNFSLVKNSASWQLRWRNLQSSIYNLSLTPFQLISEDGEIVLLARLNQKEGVSGLLYTDNIVRL
jgi:hypothetical protein